MRNKGAEKGFPRRGGKDISHEEEIRLRSGLRGMRRQARAIKKVDGVENAAVSFITQKLTLEAAEDRFDEILKEVVRVAKKVEPDTVITI